MGALLDVSMDIVVLRDERSLYPVLSMAEAKERGHSPTSSFDGMAATRVLKRRNRTWGM